MELIETIYYRSGPGEFYKIEKFASGESRVMLLRAWDWRKCTLKRVLAWPPGRPGRPAWMQGMEIGDGWLNSFFDEASFTTDMIRHNLVERISEADFILEVL